MPYDADFSRLRPLVDPGWASQRTPRAESPEALRDELLGAGRHIATAREPAGGGQPCSAIVRHVLRARGAASGDTNAPLRRGVTMCLGAWLAATVAENEETWRTWREPSKHVASCSHQHPRRSPPRARRMAGRSLHRATVARVQRSTAAATMERGAGTRPSTNGDAPGSPRAPPAACCRSGKKTSGMRSCV